MCDGPTFRGTRGAGASTHLREAAQAADTLFGTRTLSPLFPRSSGGIVSNVLGIQHSPPSGAQSVATSCAIVAMSKRSERIMLMSAEQSKRSSMKFASTARWQLCAIRLTKALAGSSVPGSNTGAMVAGEFAWKLALARLGIWRPLVFPTRS